MGNRFAAVALLCCALCCLFFPLSVTGSDAEHYRYLQRIESERADVDWLLQKGETTRLVYRKSCPGKSEKAVTTIDRRYATVSWKLSSPEEGTDLLALRKGNAIILSGTFHGKPANRTIRIDDAPWFQDMSVCLRPFLSQDTDRMEFWILRPDTLEPHKLVARKAGVVEMPVLGEAAVVQQVSIGLPGMLAPFWSATYWFKKDDGVFVKYEGPHGPPGSPMVVVSLVGAI